MINSHCQQDTAAQQNKSSLQTLSRTLSMSQGEFSLILLRCNYSAMREETVRQLRQESGIEIRELVLPTSVKTLYTTIETELADSQPQALMVFGLESVSAIDRVLTSTNYVREEFRNNFPFPVVLWVTDKILKKLIRLVTDIETWTTSVEFVLGPDELVDFLGKSGDRIFTQILESGNWRLSNSAILGANSLTELESARQDLETCNIRLEPAIEASLQFIRARNEYFCHRLNEALELYQNSLKFWKHQVAFIGPKTAFSDLLFTVYPAPVIEGIILFHIGLCYRFQAEQHRSGNRPYWTEAKNYFQECIDVLERARQADAVGIFINQLGEVLQHLEDWDALWNLAIKARRLHENMKNSTINLAQDYGFLAKVALEQKNWQGAKEWALVALDALKSNFEATGHGTPVKSQHQGLYLLILAEAQSQLGEMDEAIANLEIAREETEACYNPQLYLRVLEMLRGLYFQRGEYLKAFQIKQDYRAVEHTYRFRAFIGAGKLQPHREAINPAAETVVAAATIADEITASGREEDLNRLIYRMNNTPDKLTVIYGQSGVGKSSIVTGGLVPALQQKKIEMRTVLPVVLQVYNNWPQELSRQLSALKSEMFDREIYEALPGKASVDLTVAAAGAVNGNLGKGVNGTSDVKESAQIEHSEPVKVILEKQAIEYDKIIKELQINSEHLVTVLIFDQFEEFFFVWKEPAERQIFFNFLRECLTIKYLKVVLSLREDYLHYLLEFSRPKHQSEFINNDILADILSKDILFYLGNFSQGDARSVIRTLTERSQFYLEPELIEELVKDLAGEWGEVRPIELQLVGAQLQQEDIRTLSQYQELGDNPQHKLVERFVEEVIKDCGPENEVAARRVLYFLTDEDEIRPLKTRAELASDLAIFAESDKLDLVLELLVKSGLVFRWTELPIELYQLVHDYLVSFIRQQQELDKKAEFEELRKQNQINRDEIEQIRKDREQDALLSEARDKQHQAEAQLYQSRKWQLRAAILGVLVLGGVSWMGFEQAKLAESARQEAETSRTDALNSASEALVISNEKNQLGVLENSIKIGRDSLKSTALPVDTKNKIAERLREAVSGVQESNRFEQHSKFVLDVSVSPDGNLVASASADKTVKLWSKKGKLLKTFKHGDSVTSVSFSPDGKTIATGGADRTIKIWQVDNDRSPIATLSGHTKIVTSVSFSPDGKTLASASHDNTIKIWNLETKTLLQTLTGHKDWVLGVSFSPDGKTIATGSADKTVKLWNRQGKTQKFQINPKTLTKHSDIVYSVKFSPNSQRMVSASADTTAKIWNAKGEEITTLKGHNDAVVSASFSRDGEKIVTGSADDTVKIWSPSGTLLNTFRGHQDDVRAVTFSSDGTIASASKDKMVKIWQPNKTPLNKILSGHEGWVYKVSFSADGKTIASASRDQTVRLWRPDGSLIKILQGHNDSVTWTGFSPDNKIVASASDDKTVKIWNYQGKLLDTLSHSGIVRSVSFSLDGKIIAAASADRKLYLWRWNGAKATLLAKLDHSNPVISVSFSPDGKTIATATAADDKAIAKKTAVEITGEKRVYLWEFNGTSAKIVKTLDHGDRVRDVSFSPDGKTLAAAGADKKVYLWAVGGKAANLTEKLDHSDTVESVSFSPDGKLIAAASAGNTVKLWNFDGKQALLSKTLESSDRVLSVTFSSDSKTLAFASRDRTVILWPLQNLELNNMIARSCEWLGDYLQNDPNVAEGDRLLCLGFGKQALNKRK
ncbi:nSTAND1 domain-containing NTPase [Microcoleus sp. herbarium12]|uniref:WD40 domain-containing protein n=1 Tax=Microcoleus sp. herbarium12 TaxID=3055437 RepID=UPI002FD29DC3